MTNAKAAAALVENDAVMGYLLTSPTYALANCCTSEVAHVARLEFSIDGSGLFVC